ncbi:MAG: hypothetical protein IKG58_01260 [Bacilli bacterium]|nr:hypothetical protein [Bacilli bacterium]MBR3049172.1 hypothetical protein [Bacilli bacterium]
MEDVSVDVLQIDNKEYVIIDNLLDSDSNIMYYYFANKENPEDYLIQKLADDNGTLHSITRDEFNMALGLLRKKYFS